MPEPRLKLDAGSEAMVDGGAVAAHYGHGKLLDGILAGLRALGKSPESVSVDDLGAVDEFHIGGRPASRELIGQLGLRAGDRILDVGCGLGGTARLVASSCGARVTGIDLTREFVETGRALCAWVGLADRIELHEGSALAMPFEAEAFDAAILLHVGMNVPDKAGLFAEIGRVLRPGASLGVYDVMRASDEPLVYPVPWAAAEGTSTLATPAEYRAALAKAGFELRAERNRREFATEFFRGLREGTEAAGGPPPLGLHIVMGPDAPGKVRNMVENVAAGRVAPVEMIARRR